MLCSHPFRPLLVLAALLLSQQAVATDLPLLRDRTASDRPTVMFVGTPHFANYGQDVNNLSVPDVLSAERQAQIAKVARALAAFKPTKIAVEIDSSRQEKLTTNFQAYLAGTYSLRADEYQQLGMRMAAAAGHKNIYAIDWNEMPPGKVEDFDYLEWAEKHGKQALVARIRQNAALGNENRRMHESSVAQWLLKFNDPAEQAEDHRRYFDYAMVGDSEQQPGANWLANWYGRNLKVFAKLVALAPHTGERILVIYGAGHIFPLREFAEQSGAFNIVDPLPLLRQAL